jgi:NADH:ubiquinone oxidoreductase subunit H
MPPKFSISLKEAIAFTVPMLALTALLFLGQCLQPPSQQAWVHTCLTVWIVAGVPVFALIWTAAFRRVFAKSSCENEAS